ncbi:glutaminase liver isoform, mitochondrial-like isoform X3 [Panulirus ornatus]|uniref:glutaminase liver isoform, mitochondrial-like isoform X3 n=1 Tax=Panulirus ornatus TaxID=150431 RepID=UPI003A86B1DB
MASPSAWLSALVFPFVEFITKNSLLPAMPPHPILNGGHNHQLDNDAAPDEGLHVNGVHPNPDQASGDQQAYVDSGGHQNPTLVPDNHQHGNLINGEGHERQDGRTDDLGSPEGSGQPCNVPTVNPFSFPSDHGQDRHGIISELLSDMALPGEEPQQDNNTTPSRHRKVHFQGLPSIIKTTHWTNDSNSGADDDFVTKMKEEVADELETTTEILKRDNEEMEKISKKLKDWPILVRQHLAHVENRLFEMFGNKEKQTINISKFLMGLTATGMRLSDPRLKEMRANLKKVQERVAASDLEALIINYDTFMSIISDNMEVVVKAFSNSFVIPDFRGFCHHIDEIYERCRANIDGKVAHYIPQLARSNPEHWGVSICSVDGQRHSLGDVNVPFTLQSCSKPLTYAMASGVYGPEYVHSFIGMEPSGRYFNELCLDFRNKPHNPMINAGAIMTAALLKPELSAADRFDYVFNMYKRLAGGEYLGFNNAVFLSEKECADRNFALAYFMRENKCFPEGTRLHETLDFYFQLCSLEITAESGAIMAATLANGGINPLTGDPVLTVDAVRNTLTLMHSCGMYNYSGQFAFKVGLPSKSGVSGCVLLVIPNTLGICLWSPSLDINGNSCRGVQFCMELVNRFNFHNFDNLRGHFTTKIDPRTAKAESTAQILFDLLFSAAAGDLSALRRHSLSGTDMQAKDYDGRTALHIATSEGHLDIVEYLLQNCQVHPLPKDRWGRTPLDDAHSFSYPECGDLIVECCKKRGIDVPPLVTDLGTSD